MLMVFCRITSVNTGCDRGCPGRRRTVPPPTCGTPPRMVHTRPRCGGRGHLVVVSRLPRSPFPRFSPSGARISARETVGRGGTASACRTRAVALSASTGAMRSRTPGGGGASNPPIDKSPPTANRKAPASSFPASSDSSTSLCNRTAAQLRFLKNWHLATGKQTDLNPKYDFTESCVIAPCPRHLKLYPLCPNPLGRRVGGEWEGTSAHSRSSIGG